MKKKLFFVLVVTIFSMLSLYAYAEEDIKVTINDEPIVFASQPIMQNDRILVPIRQIAEKMLFEVEWNQGTQEVTLENYNTILKCKIGEHNITKDLKFMKDTYWKKITEIPIDAVPSVINDRTYIPLRAISELFGAEVDWNSYTNTAKIFYANTYGNEVNFKDKGIEYLTKLELLFEGFASINSTVITEFNVDISKRLINCTMDELYPIEIHEGALNKITEIGFTNLNYITIPDVFSLEDIVKFPNLSKIYILKQHIKDLTPLTYKKEWNAIGLCENPILNFEPLSQIHATRIDVGVSNNNFFEGRSGSYELWLDYITQVGHTYQSVIENNITENMSQKEKIIAINNWIQENMQYDYNYKQRNQLIETLKEKYGEHYPEFYIDSILYHYGVCSDYSEMFYTFCVLMDIPCISISGTAYNSGEWGNHKWNVVKLEDENLYHIDTTWNLLFIDESELKEKYKHKWNEEDITNAFPSSISKQY